MKTSWFLFSFPFHNPKDHLLSTPPLANRLLLSPFFIQTQHTTETLLAFSMSSTLSPPPPNPFDSFDMANERNDDPLQSLSPQPRLKDAETTCESQTQLGEEKKRQLRRRTFPNTEELNQPEDGESGKENPQQKELNEQIQLLIGILREKTEENDRLKRELDQKTEENETLIKENEYLVKQMKRLEAEKETIIDDERRRLTEILDAFEERREGTERAQQTFRENKNYLCRLEMEEDLEMKIDTVGFLFDEFSQWVMSQLFESDLSFSFGAIEDVTDALRRKWVDENDLQSKLDQSLLLFGEWTTDCFSFFRALIKMRSHLAVNWMDRYEFNPEDHLLVLYNFSLHVEHIRFDLPLERDSQTSSIIFRSISSSQIDLQSCSRVFKE